MRKYLLGFFAGIFLTGSLFQFDINLPSYDSKTAKKLQAKQTQLKKSIADKKKKIASKHTKKIAKKTALTVIPIVGATAIITMGANEYCEDLEETIELSNLVNDENESFSKKECLAEAKTNMGETYNEVKEFTNSKVDKIKDSSVKSYGDFMNYIDEFFEENND